MFEVQRAMADGLTAEFRRRGHVVGQTDNSVNTVDGVFVGVWLMPKKKGKWALRVGFSDNLLEYPNPTPADVEKLADWVLAWLVKNREASVARMRGQPGLFDEAEAE